MVPPVGLLFQFRVALEKLDRDLAFQGTHQLGNGKFRWYRNQQIYVVVPNVELTDHTFLPFAPYPYVVIDQFLYGALQYAEPVLWNPNNMVITLVNDMAKFPIFTHDTKIGIAIRT